MKTLGIIGTAKNTGKTTTLSFVLNKLQEKNKNIAVTGIGYDGEEFDNITNLPKPRIFFREQSIVVTSEKCLNSSRIDFEVIEETSLFTPLGKIYIVRLKETGKVVVAGPNTTRGLKEVISLIENKFLSEIILVDGSLNRIAPMYILDKLIFTTGASRNQNIDQLVYEMKVIERLFSYPKTFMDLERNDIVKIFYNNEVINLNIKLLIGDDDFLKLEKEFNKNANKILLPNLVSLKKLTSFIEIIKRKVNKSISIIFKSPLQLLMAGEFANIYELLDTIDKNDIEINYLFKPELCAITINPFYPKQEKFTFTQAYIDKDELFDKMSKNLRTPVFNILESGSEKILDLM